jgi:membrane peptidoglycan carboxypeptidase
VAVLAPGDVPDVLADAVVAIEDERFFSHHGLDVVGLVRSGLYDATHHCLCQGGSTITQQLAKLAYLGSDDRGVAKLTDMALALKIETRYGKREILADYLSVIPTGPTIYGVARAACAYFHRPLGELDLAEYALLAGLTQAPSLYDPLTRPDLAIGRRAAVLAQMRVDSFISPGREAAANAEPLLPSPPPGAATC